MDEKEKIEREALAFFLRLYNRKFDRKFRLAIKRECPDFEIEEPKSGERIGVEVSHIFHDKKEAMMMMGRDLSTIHGIITAKDHVDVLMEILKKKAHKMYVYDRSIPIVLVLRDFSNIFTPRILFDERLGLKIPHSDYKEIWYLARSRPMKKWDRLVRLK
jgi:hypothetical protein